MNDRALDFFAKKLKELKEDLVKDAADPRLATRESKIKQLRQQIDAGTYRPDPKKIADRVVESGDIKLPKPSRGTGGGRSAEALSFNKSGQWTIEKSGYGPKKGGQYTTADNIRRKASRTGDQVTDVGPNVGVRSYSTKPGQLSAKQESSVKAKMYRAKSKKNPVKIFTEEEKAQLAEKMGLKTSKS